ncbi:MAG: three-Cys-motif partner protein TcmP [Candidatus Bathyarchaeota archaeon]|nr:three-Cys-motif partner protein TcmP [Candidatus Bathyarchaeota archaeon]
MKCVVIGVYYPFWWGITSGGPGRRYRYHTAIVEMHAATGEVYIEETNETVLGSAGHALQLKNANPMDTQELKIILIEENDECYNHLKNVIRRRWQNVSIDEAEGPIDDNSTNIYLFNESLPTALDAIQEIDLGNAIFFFDPLRSVEFPAIDKACHQRITVPFRTGTELLIFVFTSDWFMGRDDFTPLPHMPEEDAWTSEETETIREVDFLLGDTQWRNAILNNDPIEDKEKLLIELYRKRLHRWFRYVFPMPFCPRAGQIFHTILCSNYATGVKRTRDFYCDRTPNLRYAPNNVTAYQRFRQLHSEVFTEITGNRRPVEWKILWKIIREHEEGICDVMCKDLRQIERSDSERNRALLWLNEHAYIGRSETNHMWQDEVVQFKLNWNTLQANLGVNPPDELVPLTLEDVQ